MTPTQESCGVKPLDQGVATNTKKYWSKGASTQVYVLIHSVSKSFIFLKHLGIVSRYMQIIVSSIKFYFILSQIGILTH